MLGDEAPCRNAMPTDRAREWCIDIGSLDDLHALAIEVETEVIITAAGTIQRCGDRDTVGTPAPRNVIEIYDSFRE